MELEGDHTTDSRESNHSCAKADQATFEHLKQENEHLKAENEKLRRENKQLRTRLPECTMPAERTKATLKVEECCLRMEFVIKTGELATCFKGAFQLFYGHLRSKLNKKIESSVKKLEENAGTCLKELKDIDYNLARHRQREAHSSNPDSDSDSPVEDDDQIVLKEAKEECTKIIEELKTSFEEYDKLFSAEDMRTVSPAPTVTGTDVGSVECKDFLLKIDEMCRELAECKKFFEKLHDAVMFTLEQKKRFRSIHKLIQLHKMHTQHSEVDCVQESGEHVSRSDTGIYTAVHRGDDLDDTAEIIGCFSAVSRELSEGSSKWHRSMNSCVETLGQNLKERVKEMGSPKTDNEEETFTGTVTTELTEPKDKLEMAPDGADYRQRVLEQQKVITKEMPTASDPTSESSSLTVGDTVPSPKTVKAFLEFYQQRMLNKVVATAVEGKLLNGKVIPEALSKRLKSEASDTYEANTMLFQHAVQSWDFEACLVLCDAMRSESGYPKMNRLGEVMWGELKNNEIEYRANDL